MGAKTWRYTLERVRPLRVPQKCRNREAPTVEEKTFYEAIKRVGPKVAII